MTWRCGRQAICNALDPLELRVISNSLCDHVLCVALMHLT